MKQERLTQVQSDLSALSTTVSGLTSSIAAIPTTDSTADLSGLTTDLAAAQTAIDVITAALADVSTADDLAAVNTAIADLQVDVDTLLEADAVINQPITINNAATLEYVSTLIASGDDDPNVFVNGDVTIDLTAITAAGSVTLANAIAGKIRTILGNVVVTSAAPLNFSSLSFIDGNYSVSGSDANDTNLRTISGSLTTNYAGANDYSHLSSVGAVVISNSVSATSVVFGDSTTVASIDDVTPSIGVVDFPNADLISLGTAPVTSVTANKASTVELKAVAAAGGLSISATAADAINLNSLASSGGTLSITGTATTIIHADALATADVLTVVDSDQSWFGALTSATGAISVAADSASAFGALTAINANSSIGGDAVILTALAATSTGTLTLPDALALNAPALVNDAVLSAPKAISVTLKSSSDTDLDVDEAASITLTDQAVDFTIAASTAYPALTSLSITGKDVTDVTTNDVSITAATTLTTINTAGELQSLTVVSASTTDITTAGNLTDFSINGAAALVNLTLGHTYISGDDAATISVVGATKLATLDMSNVAKVKTITATGNAILASIVAPSTTVLPEAGATIGVTLGTNSLTAVYTEGATGTAATETTPAEPAVEPTITSASVSSILAWWTAATAVSSNTGTTDIDIELVTVGTTAAASLATAYTNDAYNQAKTTSNAGTISTAAERSEVQ